MTFKIGDRVKHKLVAYTTGTVISEEYAAGNSTCVRVDFDEYKHGSCKNMQSCVAYLTLVQPAEFKAGQRVEYIGNDSPGLAGYFGTVRETTNPDNVEVVWEGKDPGSNFRGDNSSGVYPRNIKLAALQPKKPSLDIESIFNALDVAGGIDWAAGMGKTATWFGPLSGTLQNLPRYQKYEAPVPSNKLTADNKDSEETSTFHSATDGRIPLSFKGRHLMQRLRSATYAAIQFNNWHVFGDALSRARAALVFRMSELESRLDTAQKDLAVEREAGLAVFQDKVALESALRVAKSISNVYQRSSARRLTQIQELQATVTANEQFIELQRDRLQKLRDRTDLTTQKIREALDVFVPETDGKSFDP